MEKLSFTVSRVESFAWSPGTAVDLLGCQNAGPWAASHIRRSKSLRVRVASVR